MKYHSRSGAVVCLALTIAGCGGRADDTKNVDVAPPTKKNLDARQWDGETLFRAMEKKLLDADAIQFAVNGATDPTALGGFRTPFHASVILARGNRMLLKCTYRMRLFEIVSDGTRTTLVMENATTIATPAHLNSCLIVLLSRNGVFVAQTMMHRTKLRSFSLPADGLAKNSFSLSDFEAGPVEKMNGRDVRAVQFRCGGKDAVGQHATVWIDVAALTPVKFAAEMEETSITETYDDFNLNPIIDPSIFKP